MADQFLHSPKNPHFFQPLLPNFLSHLNIPVAFFSRHIKARNYQNNTSAKLRSDASDETWVVKMDGLKLTDGWKDFAVAHDLRIGDFVIFRHEGKMLFHVTVLGPSCCEIPYSSSLPSDTDTTDDESDINLQTNTDSDNSSKLKKNPRQKISSSPYQSSFVANVSAWSLENDRLYLPLSFATSIGLTKNCCCEKLVVLNEEGRSWELGLKHDRSGSSYVSSGWRLFCDANGVDQGRCIFKLVRKSGPPVIRLCRAESSSDCFVGSVAPSSLYRNSVYLPKSFVISNGLNKVSGEVVLQNELGKRWTLLLKHNKPRNRSFLERGWRSFCQENGLKDRDSFMFKLVGTREQPVFRLCLSESSEKTPLECPEDSNDVNSLSSDTSGGEDSSESLEDEIISEESCVKISSSCEASCSYSQNQFVTLTLTPNDLRRYELSLPQSFARANGINKAEKITLLSKDGVKQEIGLLHYKRNRLVRLGKGWRVFLDAHGVKVNESFVLELLREEDGSPVLKFCTKLNYG